MGAVYEISRAKTNPAVGVWPTAAFKRDGKPILPPALRFDLSRTGTFRIRLG